MENKFYLLLAHSNMYFFSDAGPGRESAFDPFLFLSSYHLALLNRIIVHMQTGIISVCSIPTSCLSIITRIYYLASNKK